MLTRLELAQWDRAEGADLFVRPVAVQAVEAVSSNTSRVLIYGGDFKVRGSAEEVHLALFGPGAGSIPPPR
jgi:hypothetical protein